MSNRRGSVLAATMGFVLVFTLLGLATIYLGTVQNEAAEKRIASTKAFWVAEAGLQKALWEIRHHNCQGLVQAANLQSYCSSCDSCGTGNKVLAGTIAGYGDYDITINRFNTVATSVGSYPSRTSGHPLFSQRTVRLGSSVFNHALFAQGYLELEGNMRVDSYDSTVGSYDEDNPNHNGHIGSNAAGTSEHNPAIKVSGNAEIYGDVSTGGDGVGYVEYGTNAEAGSNPHIKCPSQNGVSCTDIDTHDNNVTLPSVIVPPSLTSLTSSGTITNNTTLSAGDYKYTSIDMALNSVLKIDGNVNIYLTSTSNAFTLGHGSKLILTPGSRVKVYVDGRFKVYNNTQVNNYNADVDHNGVPDGTGHAADFQVFSTYTSNGLNDFSGVFMQNNGAFYGAIYAPQTNVKIENNQGLYGAVVGEEIIVDNNGTFHYDESLAGEFAFLGKWQEL